MGATLAILAFGGLGFYLRQPTKGGTARPVAAAQEALPNLALAESDIRRITKIELTRPDDDDTSRLQPVTLEKLGQDWEMISPLKARASRSKVGDLLDNLQRLTPVGVVDAGAPADDAYDLTDAKALHVVAWTGAEKVCDLYFGKTVAEGQLVRQAGGPAIFVIANTGSRAYLGFLYTRGVRSWRETSIFQFRADEAVLVEITNKSGRFSFSRNGSAWDGSFTPRGPSGLLGSPEREWRFDGSRVDDLLRATQSLSADDFGGDEDRASSGVEDAETTGGVVRIGVADAKGDRTLRVGNLTKSTTRWGLRNSRWAMQVGDATLYALSPWTAGWATVDASGFERRDDSETRKAPELGKAP